jgi:hypothetical protein
VKRERLKHVIGGWFLLAGSEHFLDMVQWGKRPKPERSGASLMS